MGYQTKTNPKINKEQEHVRWTFYMGIHNGSEDGKKPKHQLEVIREFEMDGPKATRLLRLMKEMLHYMLTGHETKVKKNAY